MDDGAFLAVKLLGELACEGGQGGLKALIADLEEPQEFKELRLKVKAGHDRREAAERVLKAFGYIVEATASWEMEEENYEGLRARVGEVSKNKGADQII